MEYLVDTLDVSPNRIFSRFDADSQVDIEVYLGSDWAASTPSP
jgi:hypothetical protein